jgi:putative membrane protein
MSQADASLDAGLAPATLTRLVPVVLAVAVVALQIAYPLVPAGQPLDALTVATVVVFAGASITHALIWRGARFALALVIATTLGGLAVEVVGVATGFPFGEYRYTGSLGTEWMGVPLVVALAWTMMAYPAYVVSELVGGRLLWRTVVGGWALTSWDLFLDPQMVQAGHWRWETTGLEVGGIPVSNYVAWMAVATLMMLTLRALAGPDRVVADDRVPLALYGWTWASSVLAHAVFFGLPSSAVAGGIGMGVVVWAAVRAARRTTDPDPALPTP